MKPLSAIVVDDEVAARRRLRRMLGELGVDVVGEAAGAPEALDLIEMTRPQLMFLDIEMPEISGIELARSLDRETAPRIVFVTAYDEHAVEAFDVAAADYLLKPVTASRLTAAIDRIRSDRARHQPARRPGDGPFRRVMARVSGGWKILPATAIISATVRDKVVHIATAEGSFRTHYEIGELEHDLDPMMFLRVHRQHIVNLSQVREVRPLINGTQALVMSNGEQIIVSRSYASELKKRLHR